MSDDLIPLTRSDGDVVGHALVDPDDRAALIARGSWRLHSHGYAYRYEYEGRRRLTVLMHRVLLGLEPGDHVQGDHVNRDRLDNRRANLRIVSHAENGQNQVGRPNARSRFRNVYWDKRRERWFAQAKVGGRQRYIRTCESEIAAAQAAEAFRAEHMPFAERDPALIEAEAELAVAA
jgi:hypothetical protein